MMVEENLKNLIENKFENVKAFSEFIELPYTTVRSILQRGVLNSKVENVIRICDGLGIKPEDILQLRDRQDVSILELYYKLSLNRKSKVYKFAESQLLEQEASQASVQVFGKTAAGDPIAYGDDIVEEAQVSYVPKGAECALVVIGDSMEPEIPDGSIVFYKKQESIENGDIAILEIDGDGATCKKVFFDYDKKEIILKSINDKYPDKHLPSDKIRVIGKVVR